MRQNPTQGHSAKRPWSPLEANNNGENYVKKNYNFCFLPSATIILCKVKNHQHENEKIRPTFFRVSDPDVPASPPLREPQSEAAARSQWATSFWTQYTVLVRRNFTRMAKRNLGKYQVTLVSSSEPLVGPALRSGGLWDPTSNQEIFFLFEPAVQG